MLIRLAQTVLLFTLVGGGIVWFLKALGDSGREQAKMSSDHSRAEAARRRALPRVLDDDYAPPRSLYQRIQDASPPDE